MVPKPQSKPTVRKILVELVRSYFADSISKASAELSYFLLFSIFPVLMLVSSLLSVTNISQASLLHVLSILPGEVQRIIAPAITRYIGQINMRTFVMRVVGSSILTIYFLSRTMSSVMYNVNRIYNIPNRRGSIGQFLFEILSAAGFVVAIACSFILVILGRTLFELVSQFVAIPPQLLWMWTYGRYIFVFGFMFVFLLMLYYLAPNCIMRFRDALPGVVFTICVWAVFTICFSIYVSSAGRYDALYGSLSAIMVLLLWMYMTGIIVFLGFKLNFILMQLRHRNFICKGKPWYVRMGSQVISKIRDERKEDSK